MRAGRTGVLGVVNSTGDSRPGGGRVAAWCGCVSSGLVSIASGSLVRAGTGTGGGASWGAGVTGTEGPGAAQGSRVAEAGRAKHHLC